MSTLKTHSETPLLLLGESTLKSELKVLSSSLLSVRRESRLLTLNFEGQTIILPLTSTMTWGQLIDSLREKGLIP